MAIADTLEIPIRVLSIAGMILLAAGMFWLLNIFNKLSKGGESKRIMFWVCATITLFFLHGILLLLPGISKEILRLVSQLVLMLAGLSVLLTAHRAAKFYNQIVFEA